MRTLKAAAAAAVCGAAAAGVLVNSGGGGGAGGRSELLTVQDVRLAVGGGGQQQLTLARALHGDAARAMHGDVLTVSPDVADWIYNNENVFDGQFGPDGGWVPFPADEPCPNGICHNFYTARGERGGLRPLGSLAWKSTSREKVRGRVRAGAGRLQALGEVSDFPDIDEYVPTKEAQAQVEDIYDAFQPAEEQLQKFSPAEKTDYAEFYRAYAAYQLPHEISNRGPAHTWSPEMQGMGAELPPNLYPYSPEYYPNPGVKNVAVTINANGHGSSNSFQVSGPQQINVNVGGRGGATTSMSEVGGAGGGGAGEDMSVEGGGGYIYPDGKTAVSVAPPAPSPEYQPLGLATVEGHDAEFKAAGVDRESWGQGKGGSKDCDASNPDCSFFQDAYDDAYW